MITSGVIRKRGAIKQELDVPAEIFLREINRRGIKIAFSDSGAKSKTTFRRVIAPIRIRNA